MTSEVLVTISPTTNQPVLTRTGLSDADIALLPAIATQAFHSYSQTPLKERQAIVRRALDLIIRRKDVLAKEITEQMGRPIAYAAKEVSTAVARGAHLLKLSDECLKDTEGEAEVGFKRYIRKCPLGPVLILFAWNVRFPLVAALLLYSCADRMNFTVPLPNIGQFPHSSLISRQYGHNKTLSTNTYDRGTDTEHFH